VSIPVELNAVEADAVRMFRIVIQGTGVHVPFQLCLFHPGRLAKRNIFLLRGIIVQNLRGYYTAGFVL
jgi:hypothetical protein